MGALKLPQIDSIVTDVAGDLAQALVKLVDARVRAALASANQEDWTAVTGPRGFLKAEAFQAIRRSAFPEAKKSGRYWFARRAEVDAYFARQSERASSAARAVVNGQGAEASDSVATLDRLLDRSAKRGRKSK